MLKIIQQLAYVFIILWMSGCSTSSTVKFNSLPSDAEISINDNGVVKIIGKTPLTSNENDIYLGSNRFSQIRIYKEGYQDKEIVLMKSTNGSETYINVQLKKDNAAQNLGEQSVSYEKIANTIARANGLIASKQYVEAESVLLNFVEEFPTISVGFDYLGNINYLQNRYSKALKHYNRAMAINPNNSERRRIIEKIHRLVQTQSEDR